MKKVLLPMFIAALAPFNSFAAAPIEVHGHRGSRGTAPENTLPAFTEALKAGVDVLELDMNVTADGFVVVFHDQFVNPVLCLEPEGKPMSKPVPIRGLKLEELRKYDCGTIKNPRFPMQVPRPGTGVPLLGDVFQLVLDSKEPAAAQVRFNIETKIVPGKPELSPEPAEFAEKVVAVVKRYGMQERTIVQSFDWRTLKEVKKLDPKIRTALLISENLMNLEAVAKTSGVDIISPAFDWITKEAVEGLQKSGIPVIPWTLNTKKDWDRAIAYGVDAIITDYPADLIAYMKEKKLR